MQCLQFKLLVMKAIGLFCMLLVSISIPRVNAQNTSSGLDNYVVVLGAFTTKENANRFSRKVVKQKLQPKTEMNQLKNLYYVYVLQTPDHAIARAEADRLRKSGPYKDAWVFTGTVQELAKSPEVVLPLAPPMEEPIPKEVVVEAIPVVVPKEKTKEEKIKEEVDAQSMATKKGEMDRLDYIFFYRDAAVLRPESRFEVDRLVGIMKENPKLELRIHGHTNGNDPGKIFKRANESSDFFSLDGTVEGYGSAKELSEERATLIRDYLVNNGIDKKRMSVKAWGGKKPLYPVDDIKAEANVRVEIEVLRHE